MSVSKSYRIGTDEIQVLSGIDLRIEKGEFVAILGPSGSGKTTLMNIIGCLDMPSSGKYVLDGLEVGSLSNGRVATVRNRCIGFIFQNFYLLPRLNAIRNVEIPMIYGHISAADRRLRAKKLLTQVGLSDRLHHRPTELSGGQKQRVAIARALANMPNVLLADEPTGALDSVTSREILKLIQEVNQEGTTVVMITHDTSIAQFAKRVIRMRDGKIESDGEPS